jgi:hypothetical protein
LSIGIIFENGGIFGPLYFGLGICFSGGTQIKLNVGQFEAAKRKEIVDSAAQMADKWVREDQKEILIKKSNEPLDKLMNGLTETAAHFQGIVDGAAQMAEENKKKKLRKKSDDPLGNLINGLTETASHFQGIVDGAAQMAKEDTKETLRNKSDESLGKDL